MALIKSMVVRSDPEILGGDTLDEFRREFPSVKRTQAVAALELARDTLLSSARSV
jgi:hypothetical protein